MHDIGYQYPISMTLWCTCVSELLHTGSRACMGLILSRLPVDSHIERQSTSTLSYDTHTIQFYEVLLLCVNGSLMVECMYVYECVLVPSLCPCWFGFTTSRTPLVCTHGTPFPTLYAVMVKFHHCIPHHTISTKQHATKIKINICKIHSATTWMPRPSLMYAYTYGTLHHTYHTPLFLMIQNGQVMIICREIYGFIRLQHNTYTHTCRYTCIHAINNTRLMYEHACRHGTPFPTIEKANPYHTDLHYLHDSHSPDTC